MKDAIRGHAQSQKVKNLLPFSWFHRLKTAISRIRWSEIITFLHSVQQDVTMICSIFADWSVWQAGQWICHLEALMHPSVNGRRDESKKTSIPRNNIHDEFWCGKLWFRWFCRFWEKKIRVPIVRTKTTDVAASPIATHLFRFLAISFTSLIRNISKFTQKDPWWPFRFKWTKPIQIDQTLGLGERFRESFVGQGASWKKSHRAGYFSSFGQKKKDPRRLQKWSVTFCFL